MDTIIAWIKSKNWTTHTVIVVAIAAATAYSTNEPLRDLVLSVMKNHPVLLGNLGLAVAAILKASSSSSAAGTVAKAETIMESPAPPTPAAIEAAKPSSK